MQTSMDYPVLYHNNIDAEPDQSSVSMIDLLWENSSLSGFHGNNISLCPPQQCSCLYRTCCRTATFTNKTLPNSDCEVCYSLSQYQHVTYGQYRRGKLAATISLSAREHATKDTSQTFCFPQRSYSTSKMYVCPWSMSCGHTTYPNSPAVNINTTSPLSHLSCPPPSNTDLPSPSPHQYPLYHLHNPQTPEEDHCYPNTSPLSIYDSNCSLDSSSINSPAVSPPQLSTSQALAPISCFKSNVQERLGEEVVGEDCTELQKDGSTSPRVVEVRGPAYRSHFRNRQARTDRLCFTPEQIRHLESSFDRKKYLSQSERQQLSQDIGISPSQVKTWYQNRRTKWKRNHKIVQ